MFGNFKAYNFEDFKNNYLIIEKDLDKSPQIRLGELSKILTRTNLDITKKLNGWASDISSTISKYVNKLQKHSSFPLGVRTIPVGDGEAAAIVIVKIGSNLIETSIFDNNKIVIKMPKKIADIVNQGNTRKFVSNRDRASKYLIGILERIANDV